MMEITPKQIARIESLLAITSRRRTALIVGVSRDVVNAVANGRLRAQQREYFRGRRVVRKH